MDLDGDEMDDYGAGDDTMMAEEEDGVEDAPSTGGTDSWPPNSRDADDPGGGYGHSSWGDDGDEEGRRAVKDARLSATGPEARIVMMDVERVRFT